MLTERRIVLASNNRGKLREFSEMLGPLGIVLTPQGELGVPEAAEPFDTFVENALQKARHAARITGLPALADDSGLCVPALGGAPGVHSARYALLDGNDAAGNHGSGGAGGGERSDAANNSRLLRDIAPLAQAQRHAYYYCVLVFMRAADDPRPVIAEGEWHGRLIDVPRGTHGFGYDPLFLIESLGRTAAELEPQQKNHLSHRSIALASLVQTLKDAA
ncbi:MAG: RdgB/HAM1 family non-canonical purine NTP pyrophosphatase [Janthinobacterium lividum]